MSCKQVLCVHLYSTDNYSVFSCCVLLLVFENFVLSILLCFLSLLNMIQSIHCIYYKFIQKCHSLLHQTACIFTRFWLTIQMQRANQFFSSTGGRRIRKSLVFGQAVLILTSPQSFLSPKTASYAGYVFILGFCLYIVIWFYKFYILFDECRLINIIFINIIMPTKLTTDSTQTTSKGHPSIVISTVSTRWKYFSYPIHEEVHDKTQQWMYWFLL